MITKHPAYRYFVAPLLLGGVVAVSLSWQAAIGHWNVPPIGYILAFFLGAIFALVAASKSELDKK